MRALRSIYLAASLALAGTALAPNLEGGVSLVTVTVGGAIEVLD
jgi:hypothetical protein